MEINFLNELNSVQYQAVTNIEGPVMVIAGPGSGKTRVLTYRIAYMIHQGVKPWEILTLTFTNKAAREMKERIEKLIGPSANQVWAGTFHSVFAKILRIEANKIGFPSSFVIYDTEDSKTLIGRIIQELNLDKNTYPTNAIRNRISSAKSSLINFAGYKQSTELLEQDKMNKMPLVWKIYEEYTIRCKAAGAMDFDDLLLNVFTLFHRNPDNILAKYQEKFKYLLVDEFQDTNFLQYSIIKKLVRYPKSPENICIVGDDAQSIYAFRGATIENILDFEKDFQRLKVFKLEQNYRSTKHIVDAANRVITNNQNQIKKEIWTDYTEKNKIGLIRALSQEEEGRKVVDGIFDVKNRYHILNKDIAILYRTNAQSRVFEEFLRKNNIPYRIYGGLSFYSRKEIKDVLAYFKLVINVQEEESFRRIVNFPKRGIGDTTLDKLFQVAKEQGIRYWDAIDHPSFAGKSTSKLSHFKQLIESLIGYTQKHNADESAREIYLKSGLYQEYRSDLSIEGQSRLDNITAFLDGITEYVENDDVTFDEGEEVENDKSLDNYLQNIALLTDQDQEKGQNDQVSLMSIHAAKGLEFEVVFVTGLEENLFPSFMSLNSPDDIDEERRLFYVAITRAKRILTLSYATSRYQYGKTVYNKMSRFLEEVGEDNLDAPLYKASNLVNQVKPTASVSGHFSKRSELSNQQFSVVPSAPEAFSEGSKVLHSKFGKGIITKIDGATNNRIATIRFDQLGNEERRIMLKFSKMQVLN